MRIRFTWSRMAANPVEHIADHSLFMMPICGAVLRVETQKISDGHYPSGLVPVCGKCVKKLFRFVRVRDGFYRNDFFGVSISRTRKPLAAGRFVTEWAAQENLDGGGFRHITSGVAMAEVRETTVAYLKEYADVKNVLAEIERKG